MNILIFQHTYFPFVGGAEVAVREITERLGKIPPFDYRSRQALNSPLQRGEQIEFDLITARLNKNLPKYERIGNANVYRVGLGWILDKYLYPILAYLKALKLHKENKYDIVQGIMATWGGIAAMFFKLRYKDVKYLLTEQSGDSDFFIWIRTWFWYPIYRMFYTKANFVQPISNWLEKRVRRYGYKGMSKIVPNGVDFKKFKMKNEKLKIEIENLKLRLRISEDEIVIITTSRLVKKNGIRDLIRAVKIIRDQKLEIRNCLPAEADSAQAGKLIFPHLQGDLPCILREVRGGIKLLIAGTGKLENKLKKLVKELCLQDEVIFLGHISQEELPRYLWASDIFCRPSLSEGQGVSLLEAMAVGIPVIATPVGGIPDFLEDGKTGIFCKVSDPKSIADAVLRLLSDRALYDKIVGNGRRLVEERYDWEIISREMREIYKRLAG